MVASPKSIVATWVGSKPSARMTATSEIRSRTFIAIEFAATSSTVITTTAQRLKIIVLRSAIAETPFAIESLSVMVLVSYSELRNLPSISSITRGISVTCATRTAMNEA